MTSLDSWDMPARQRSMILALSACWRAVSFKRVMCPWSAGLERSGGAFFFLERWSSILTAFLLLEVAEEVLFDI